MKNVVLFVITNRGTIALDFVNLEAVDRYTVRFNDEDDLLREFGKIAGRDFSSVKISDIYIEYEYVTKNNKLKGRIPVKYRSDNYDDDSLREVFTEYLKEDYERIYEFDIRFMKSAKIIGYINYNEGLSDIDIELAVRSYLKDNSYKKKRDVYFKLKNKGRKVRIKRVNEEVITGNGDISKFDIEDDYLMSLANYAKRGEEEYQKVMDLISLYDIDYLQDKLKHPYYKMVDGMNEYDQVFYSDIVSLEIATNGNIDTIKNIIDKSIKESKIR